MVAQLAGRKVTPTAERMDWNLVAMKVVKMEERLVAPKDEYWVEMLVLPTAGV
jgi:hypothetical protein